MGYLLRIEKGAWSQKSKKVDWNHHSIVLFEGLVNLDFDDNNTRFRTNDHISSVIRQDDFQSGNHKGKSSQ